MSDQLRQQRDIARQIEQQRVIERPGGVSGQTTFFAVGTFTPILVGSTIAGTFTYTLQNGKYVRMGAAVFVSAHISISAITVAPTGNLQLGGLPFTASTPDPGTLHMSDYTGFTLGAGYSQLGGRITASATTALLIKSGSAIQALALAGGALALIAGGAEIVYSGVYQIA